MAKKINNERERKVIMPEYTLASDLFEIVANRLTDGDSLDKVVEIINDIRDSALKVWPNVVGEIVLHKPDYGNCYECGHREVTIVNKRLETDEEYNKRMAELDAEEKKEAEVKKTILEKERKEYERLKRKFEKKK